MDAEAYGDKAQHYFAHTRHDLIRIMPSGPAKRVLEVGCGRGHTLMALKGSGYAAEAVGVELVPLARTDEEQRGDLVRHRPIELALEAHFELVEQRREQS